MTLSCVITCDHALKKLGAHILIHQTSSTALILKMEDNAVSSM